MNSEFSRIAGYKEEKKELQDICNIIKKRDELRKAGGKVPRGLLLYGPVGVGKTVLAKAFIKESGYNCVDIKDDDNIDLRFKEAVDKRPCIIFVDEVDKLAGCEFDFFPSSNGKSLAMLNQINKYVNYDDLFILFVANNQHALDSALIRSGRIDKKIMVNLPNELERLEIIKYYSVYKHFDKTVSFEYIAKITQGMSGADLEALLNDAVIKAVNDNRIEISNDDIVSSLSEKVFDAKAKKANLNPKNKALLAYHEAGHAVISLLNDKNAIFCASILPRGMSNGHVSEEPTENKIATLEDYKKQVKVCLGGLAAEEVFFHQRTLGTFDDIAKAKTMVRKIVRDYGGSGLDLIGSRIVSDEYGYILTDCSEQKKIKMEEAESKLLNELFNSAKEMMVKHKHLVKDIANALIEHGVLNKEEISNIYKNYQARRKQRYRRYRHISSQNKGADAQAI